MKRFRLWVAGVGLCVATHVAAVDTISLNFEGGAGHRNDGVLPNFYNNVGITFSGGAQALQDNLIEAGQFFDQAPYSNEGFDMVDQAPFDTTDGTVLTLSAQNAVTNVAVASFSFAPSYLSSNGLTGFTRISFEYSALALTQIMAFNGNTPVEVIDPNFQPTPDGFIGIPGRPDQVGCSNDRAVLFCNWTTRTFTFAGPATSLRFYSNVEPGSVIYDNFEMTMAHADNVPDPATNVPEPSTYALMALGLTGIAMFSRRRRVSVAAA